MLIIEKKFIVNINDEMLLKEFGVNYMRCPKLDDDIAAMIEDSDTYVFESMEDFKSKVAKGKNSGGHLVRRFVLRSHPGPYKIMMTGKRSDDADAANKKAGLVSTPDGYTWHHAEGILKDGNGYYLCNMYLIKTWYHKRNHSGGVNEYERFTGKTYR